jgi:hypothetical protein
MSEDVLYQVVYCVKTKHSGEPWWQNWYLLQCPIVGISSLAEARRRAREWKDQLGVKFQPVIIGETDTDYERIGIDELFGVKAINGLHAAEMEFPDFLLEEDEEKTVGGGGR